VCQWVGHALSWARAAHLPVFNTVVRLASHGRSSATGTWRGWPSCRLLGGTWRHRTPSLGEGRSGPPRPVRVDRPTGVWLPHVAVPDPPEGSGLWRPFPNTLSLWVYGDAGPIRARGRSGDHDPSCQAWTVRLVTQRPKARSRITSCPTSWTLCQTTLWRVKPADIEISSQRTITAFWPLSRSLAMIEDRRPSMWWSASTTMRLAHARAGHPIKRYPCPYIPTYLDLFRS
jgi:hypothetical protein